MPPDFWCSLPPQETCKLSADDDEGLRAGEAARRLFFVPVIVLRHSAGRCGERIDDRRASGTPGKLDMPALWRARSEQSCSLPELWKEPLKWPPVPTAAVQDKRCAMSVSRRGRAGLAPGRHATIAKDLKSARASPVEERVAGDPPHLSHKSDLFRIGNESGYCSGRENMSLADLRRVDWGATAKLALARGLASSVVLVFLGLMFGYFSGPRAPGFGDAMKFILLWTFAGSAGGFIYFYLMKGLGAALGRVAGIFVTAASLIQILVVAMVAAGDPLIYAANRAMPDLFGVPDFKLFNPAALIFVQKGGY